MIIATYNFFEKRSTCVKLIISDDNGKLNISNLTAIGQERTRLFIFLNSLEYCTVVLFNCSEGFCLTSEIRNISIVTTIVTMSADF